MSEAPEQESRHDPVLLAEVLSWVRARDGGLFIDCRVGLGGHAEEILESSPQARVIGLDRDLETLELARERLERFGKRFTGSQANFKELKAGLDSMGISQAARVLADLGISSYQRAAPDRSFSLQTQS